MPLIFPLILQVEFYIKISQITIIYVKLFNKFDLNKDIPLLDISFYSWNI